MQSTVNVQVHLSIELSVGLNFKEMWLTRLQTQPNYCGMEHSPGFLSLVNEAKKRVNEISVAEARARVASGAPVVLMDVREDHEWSSGHAVEAVHLGKGILERDLEKLYPDKNAEIIMYCGGGFRSALTCDAAQKMGYRKVSSLIGGYKGLVAAGWTIKAG